SVRDIVAADQGAFVFPVEGVPHAQRNLRLPQAAAGARMNGLHAEVGELVCDVVIGSTDLLRTSAHDFGIGARKMELLVNDGLARARENGDARESHLRVPSRVA